MNHAVLDSVAQKSIDDEIAQLLERIRQLKERRNQLTPISKLLPEILGTVFSFVVGAQIQTLEVFPCYNFTHVSQSWRSVALATPSLWQALILPSISRPWATTMLERSKDADLVLVSDLRDPALVLFSKEVLTKHASRVRELDLRQCSASTLDTLLEGLQQSPLRLHSLHLAPTVRLSRDDHPPTFPAGFMEIESLRKLSVECYDGPWYSMSLQALTSLKLSDIPTRPSLVKFLELLRGLSTLQVLDMHNSLPLSTDLNSGLVDPINLPNLQYLELSSTTHQKEVTNILSLVVVPPSATLRFVIENFESDEPRINVHELAPSFSAFFSLMRQAHTDLLYTGLLVQSEGIGHIRLLAWKNDRSVSGTPDLEVVIAQKTHPTPIAPQSRARKIILSLPLFNIKTLILDIHPVHILLKHTFGHLPYVRSVTLVGDCVDQFIESLTWKEENHNTRLSDYNSVMFPSLEFLWIQSILFGEQGVCKLKGLQDCLMERYERKAEVLKLKFSDCFGLYSSDVERLREIVVDVEWDGREESGLEYEFLREYSEST